MHKCTQVRLKLCLTVLCIIFNISHGARILGVFSIPSVSHQIVFRALMEELAKRGHHLVVLTTDPVNYTEPQFSNLKQIDVHDISYKTWTKHFNFADQKLKDDSTLVTMLSQVYNVMLELADAQLATPEMKKIINNPHERFDLVIVESMVPVMSAFKDHFNCPLILMCSFTGMLQNFDAFGLPSHPLVYPDSFSPFAGRLNLLQKFYWVYQDVYYKYLYYWKIIPKMNNLAKRHFGPSVRSVDIIENNADMLFLNFHPIFGAVRPLVPAVIHMGSMHIKPTKPLPNALKKKLDSSKSGAIYFSLGSNVKSHQLPEEIRKIFLNVFRELPYTVFWKWEDDTLPDQPANVIISKWFPQQDVLGHPNMRAFITQGGQQSMEEAVHFGIPLIGIPFMGDQPLNVEKIVKLGIGIGLNIETITVEIMRNAVIDIIENPSYKSNVTKVRQLLYDQPQTSLERTVWWTEYVLRHRGARHLRSPAADIPAYEYYMLDLVAVALAGLSAIVLILVFTVRYLLSLGKANKVALKLKAT